MPLALSAMCGEHRGPASHREDREIAGHRGHLGHREHRGHQENGKHGEMSEEMWRAP